MLLSHHRATHREPLTASRYLFELSGKFNVFYENCPAVGAETEEARASRLALCSLSAAVLRLSLRILGIEPLEKI